jgi:uncharacterized protein
MIVKEGDEWVLKSKDGEKVLGRHKTREEAVAQERAVEAHKHSDEENQNADDIEDAKEEESGRVKRYDVSSPLKPPVRLDNGYLRVEGRIARVGIQEYRDYSGSIKREFRPPDEVFNADSLASFNLVPVTNTHPPVMLTSQNAKKYAVGSIGELRQDGDYIRADLLLHDSDAIAAAEQGRQQISNGYSCELENTPGMWNGQKYDSIQRKIRGNHVAIVDVARAGPEARMRLDSSSAFCEIDNNETQVITSRVEQRKTKMTHTLKFDGLTYEVNDPNAQPHLDRTIAAYKKSYDELLAKYDAVVADNKKISSEVFEFDGAEISVSEFKDTSKRATFMASAVEKAATARADLIVEARKHLNANEKIDKLSNLEIKKTVAATLNKDHKLDDKSAEYIEVLYNLSVEAANKNKASQVDIARGAVFPQGLVVGGVRADQFPSSDPSSARAAMIARELSANVKNGNGAR